MRELQLPDCDHGPTGIDGVTWNIMGQVYTPKQYDDGQFVWHATFPEETFVPPHTHHEQDEYLCPLNGDPCVTATVTLQVVSAAGTVAVPTLGQWGLMLLGSLLLLPGLRRLRHRH